LAGTIERTTLAKWAILQTSPQVTDTHGSLVILAFWGRC
jgi:hypothetical protein